MITDAILQFFYTICSGFFSLLPPWVNPPEVNAAATTLRDNLRHVNLFAPVSEMVILARLAQAFFTILIAFKMVKLVINWIRGAGA